MNQSSSFAKMLDGMKTLRKYCLNTTKFD